MNSQLAIDSQLDLKTNCGRLSKLKWLSNSTLLATCQEGIQIWQCDDASTKPCLLLGMSIGLVTAEASPDQSTVAAGSRDGVVRHSKKLYIVLSFPIFTRIPEKLSKTMSFRNNIAAQTLSTRIICGGCNDQIML